VNITTSNYGSYSQKNNVSISIQRIANFSRIVRRIKCKLAYSNRGRGPHRIETVEGASSADLLALVTIPKITTTPAGLINA
jgi:hypothetical protein